MKKAFLSRQNSKTLHLANGRAMCNGQTSFCRLKYLCLDKITFVQQKLLLLTKAILSRRNSKMLHLANGRAMCKMLLLSDKSDFCRQKLLLSTKIRMLQMAPHRHMERMCTSNELNRQRSNPKKENSSLCTISFGTSHFVTDT